MSSSVKATNTTPSGRRELRKQQNKLANKSANQSQGVLSSKFLRNLASAGIVSVAILGGMLFTTKRMLQSHQVKFVAPTEQAVKDAVLSGNPAVVYCMNVQTAPGIQEGSTYDGVPPMLQSIKQELKKQYEGEDDIQFLATNCFKEVDYLGNKSIAEKFSFGKVDGFVGVFANGNAKPPQFNYLANGEYVAKQILPHLQEQGVKPVIYLKDYAECQDRDACVVLRSGVNGSSGVTVSAVSEYQKQHRSLKFVEPFSGLYNLRTSKEFEDMQGTSEVACFAKTVRPLTEEEVKRAEQNGAVEIPDNKTVYRARWAPEDVLDKQKMHAFFEDCKSGLKEDGYVTLPGKHSIYATPSETKVVSRPEREGAEDDNNLGAGKEKVGRRMDEEGSNLDDDELDDLDALEDEDKVEEEVDL